MRYLKKRKFKQALSWTSFYPIVIIIVVWVLYNFSIAMNPTYSYNWKNIRANIRDTVLQQNCIGSIAMGAVGYSGSIPKYYYQREWLMNNATNNELVELTDFPGGVIKATAYEALFRREGTNLKHLIFKALNDTTTFLNLQSGCMGSTVIPIEYLVESVLHLDEGSPPSLAPLNVNLNLSDEELNYIIKVYNDRKSMKWTYLENHYKKYYDWWY